MGMITCANVLSDVYATGVTDIDSLTMILSLCEKMTDLERDIVVPKIIAGFNYNAKIAGAKVSLQSAIVNPWCIIGGTATSVSLKNEFILPLAAVPGDVLILTKPLGAQIACNAKAWCENPEKLEKITSAVTLDQVNSAYDTAVQSMIRLNKNAAMLMRKYDAHAATDVTGFGILGHAQNLAASQTLPVKFVIKSLPVIEHIVDIAKAMNSYDKFILGKRPETSGGLLMAISEKYATNFCIELKELDGWDAYIVGNVVEGENFADIVDEPNIITVPLR